jgi:tetratricopeptide (TPR) repeat protein
LIGNSYSDLNKETEAVASYNKALEIFRGKDRWGEAQTLKDLGDAYSSMTGTGNKQTAVQYYKSAIDTYAQANWNPWAAPAYDSLGDVYAADYAFDSPPEQAQKAEDAYRQAVKFYKEQSNTEKAVATLMKIAKLFNDYDQPAKVSKAYDAYAEAASTYEGANMDREAGKAFTDLAVLQRRHRKPDLAEGNYEKAAIAYERGGDLNTAARILRSAASMNNCEDCDNPKKRKAANFYQRSIALYEKIGKIEAMPAIDRNLYISSLTSLVEIYSELGEKKLAGDYRSKLDTLKRNPN